MEKEETRSRCSSEGSSVGIVSRRSEVRSLAAAPLTLTAHQPVFLPWAGLFEKIASADRFIWLDTVQFERHGFENRVQIKTHQGAQWLTAPVKHGHAYGALLGDHGWHRKHLRSIELAYRKAPYFESYWDGLSATMTIASTCTMLSDFNRLLMNWCLEQLGMDVELELASRFDFQGEKSALVLDMCKQIGATKYIFGQKGKDYADVESFKAAGIEVEFQSYKRPVYRQLHGPFVPGLSIIDLLMNEGPNSLEILTT